MKLENKCYVLKSDLPEELDAWAYNPETGILEQISGWRAILSFPVRANNEFLDRAPIFITENDILGDVQVIMFDRYDNFIGTVTTQANNSQVCELDSRTCSIGVNIRTLNPVRERIWFYCGFEVNAIYSKLEKKLKKEKEQMFFRETLEGNIKLIGRDFEYAYSSNLEQNMLFAFYSNGQLKAKNVFNKTDCKLDLFKKQITLKLTALDKYSDILDKYENTYDLIKLAPAITPLILTKRMALQVYIKGANDVTTICNGTYWQDDVDEIVDDEEKLLRKYYFAKNHSFREVHLSELPAPVNGTYTQLPFENSWKTIARDESGEQVGYSDIYFEKEYEEGDYIGDIQHGSVKGFSDDDNIDVWDQSGHSKKDLYRIKIRFSYYSDMQSPLICYVSENLYAIDDDSTGFMMTSGDRNYNMESQAQAESFYLGDNIIEYDIFTRVIADVDSVEVEGVTQQLYDLPYDDFTYRRANYKKCIGIETDVYWKFFQVKATLEEPTKYGMDDYKKYFTSNFATLTTLYNKPIPISRNSWADTSIWLAFTDLYWTQDYESKYRVEFTLKDAYSISDAIVALLKQINPEIKHAATSEYSEFLYGNGQLSLGENALFIAPKSNVLKGNYDQAAQKAEITFKQLMDMLKDCFRCYWYIDEQNRFRIEHVSYFINGMSYSEQGENIDLRNIKDKFNNKKVLYCQEEIEFEKADLASRFEFGWEDDSTDLFGNNYIDVNAQYVQKDKTESIIVDIFSADVDFMLFAPDKFNSDGFALLVADKETHKVPIATLENFFKDDEYINPYTASVQNWPLSWLYLINYYMYDMPASNISCSGIYSTSQPAVEQIKKCMKNEIRYSSFDDPSVNNTITTEIGKGTIDEISINLSTRLISIVLQYVPA